MATLTVWKFDSAYGAEEAEGILKGLEQQELITIHDAAIVSWEEGKKKPKTKQATNLKSAGALGGAFWGMLFGLIFFVPLLGLAVGAATGAIAGSMADVGIDDDFIKRIRERVTPGTSALFLLSSGAVMDKIEPAVASLQAELIQTNLSEEDEARLREV